MPLTVLATAFRQSLPCLIFACIPISPISFLAAFFGKTDAAVRDGANAAAAVSVFVLSVWLGDLFHRQPRFGRCVIRLWLWMSCVGGVSELGF
ncbi:hypothetical protein [Neisseria iguanae]|uniref:hypothetical protein n=1 Tax=Neisseria iguanae TaxID=90242 RepID=UPI0011B28450|nr:hypothetical protein [Neisseria iguanae]